MNKSSKALSIIIAIIVFAIPSVCKADLILTSLTGNQYQIELTSTMSFTMTADVAQHGAWRVVDFFDSNLPTSGTYVSGAAPVQVNGGSVSNINYNSSVPWSGAGNDFLFNFQSGWAAGTGGVVSGDVVTILPHSMVFNFNATLPNVSSGPWQAYITDGSASAVRSTFASISSVPEPSGAMLIGSLLAGIAVQRRKRGC